MPPHQPPQLDWKPTLDSLSLPIYGQEVGTTEAALGMLKKCNRKNPGPKYFVQTELRASLDGSLGWCVTPEAIFFTLNLYPGVSLLEQCNLTLPELAFGNGDLTLG